MNEAICQTINTLIKNDGLHETPLKEVKIFRTQQASPRAPLLYDLCLIIVLQGKKIGYLGNHTYHYDCKNYLVVPTTIPFECQTIASKEEPFVCMLISIDKKEMIDILEQIENKPLCKEEKIQHGLFTDKITSQHEDTILRLVKVLSSKEESKILGKQILRELYYRIAMGENAHYLQKIFLNSQNEAKIAQILRTIHKNYDKTLHIPSLAKQSDMSVASFHTHFKKFTAYTPLQYIKRLRLNKAKELITKHHYQVSQTAQAIGYESSSQFSRDFKSFFGLPPKEAKASFEEYSYL